MSALQDPRAVGYQIARDPSLVKNRIFLGNLPTCTQQELESICHRYGNVLGAVVHKNFGFVQFESEEVANKCASALNRSSFKSKILTVQNASVKSKGSNQNSKKNNSNMNGGGGGSAEWQVPMALQAGIVMPAAAASDAVPVNECEIIVVNRENTKYAEYIEDRMKKAGMRVDVLFPSENVILDTLLSNIKAQGCIYAVLVTPEHEALNSITVHILYGVPAEHRNMPLDDAITLIATDCRQKKQRESHISQNRHPDAIQKLFRMLADNRQLTGFQYEGIINYLGEQWEQQLKLELGEANAMAKLRAPDPDIELQKKILSIMNKPPVTEISYEMMYPTFEAAKADKRLMELLQDPRVMSAMESLYNSDLLETVSQYL